MLAYSGSVPGPTVTVPQGATITVHVTNHGDLDATVHWHGLRLENRYDGTHDTQAPIPVGERFTYRVHVPDAGAYWYHPHIREDYGQEMGLYGNILVTPSDTDYWPPANRELVLTLDDILIEEGQIAAFRESETTHVAMGRFGNVMLVAGEPDLSLKAKRTSETPASVGADDLLDLIDGYRGVGHRLRGRVERGVHVVAGRVGLERVRGVSQRSPRSEAIASTSTSCRSTNAP